MRIVQVNRMLTFAAVGAVVMGLYSSQAYAAGSPINVGCVAALSGPGAEIGNRMREGAELAVASMPEVAGRPVRLLVRDSKGDPATAQQQALSLVSEQDILGLACTTLSSEAAALSAASRAGRLSVPTVHSSALADDVTGKNCSAWTFRTVPSATEIANAVTKFAVGNAELNAAGWYILASDYLYGRSVAKAFTEIPGIKIDGQSFAPLDTGDWTPYLNKITISGAKGVWLPVANGSPYVQLFNQAVGFQLLERVTVVAPGGMPQDLLDQLGDKVLGVSEPASAVLLTNPGSRDVAEAYLRATGKSPAEQGLQSYVGVNILLQAIAAAKEPTREGVRSALQSTHFETILGSVAFRPGDQQLLAPVWPATVQKLPVPIAGAQYGFVATGVLAAVDVLPAVAQTGCHPG